MLLSQVTHAKQHSIHSPNTALSHTWYRNYITLQVFSRPLKWVLCIRQGLKKGLHGIFYLLCLGCWLFGLPAMNSSYWILRTVKNSIFTVELYNESWVRGKGIEHDSVLCARRTEVLSYMPVSLHAHVTDPCSWIPLCACKSLQLVLFANDYAHW